MDACLSFRLFNSHARYSHQCMADSISWELQSLGIEYFLHHLDNFSDPGACWLKPMWGEVLQIAVLVRTGVGLPSSFHRNCRVYNDPGVSQY